MDLKVGTFNLNNLFSRFNFKAEITKSSENKIEGEIEYKFSKGDLYRLRTYQGKLVKPKSDAEQKRLAERIIEMDLDVLALQEVEDIDVLRSFNKECLNSLYKHEVLHEGNDPRLIDLGLLSKYPIGGITSWQYEVHPSKPEEKVFGRDLVEVDVMSTDRSKKLFTVFNNHLKSQFVNYWEDKEEAEKKSNERRLRQAEVVAQVVRSRMKRNDLFMVVGDMNVGLDSPTIAPLINDRELNLVDGLRDVSETHPLKIRENPPSTAAWTHRFKESGSPPSYELFDQIWLSPKLAEKQQSAWINRRAKLTKDGSDHDPAWVVLSIQT